MRLVIVDDHPLFRMGLKYMLTQQGFDIIAEAEDGSSALDACREHKPDVILLDVKMPKMDGIAVCEALQQIAPEIVIIFITTFSEPAIIQAARDAGARGYVSKETTPALLAEQIREVVSSDINLLPDVSVPRLTPRESDVLPLVAQGLSNKKIALLLGVSPDTIKDHLARIYFKLSVNDRTEAVSRARELGLIPR